jgi:hypothetical protein
MAEAAQTSTRKRCNMPLNFDPTSLMAPGGIVSGLDDIGAAVTNAMASRAHRRYKLEAEARARKQQLEDRQEGYQHEQTLYDRGRGDQKADRATAALGGAAGEETDEDSILAALQEAEDSGRLDPDHAAALRAEHAAKKAQFGQRGASIDARGRPPTPLSVPALPTKKDENTGGQVPDYGRGAGDLETRAVAAEAAGRVEEAAAFHGRSQRYSAIDALGAPPEDTTARDIAKGGFGDFFASEDYRALNVPGPGNNKENTADILDIDPRTGAVTRKSRGSLWDSPDEDYVEDDANFAKIDSAGKAYVAKRKKAGAEAHARKLSAYEAMVRALRDGLDPETAKEVEDMRKKGWTEEQIQAELDASPAPAAQ